MKARVSQLHKIEAEWLKLNDWTPEAGEIIVYDPDESFEYSRIKLGDGQRALKDLSFFIDSTIADYLQKQRRPEILDGGRITDYNK